MSKGWVLPGHWAAVVQVRWEELAPSHEVLRRWPDGDG